MFLPTHDTVLCAKVGISMHMAMPTAYCFRSQTEDAIARVLSHAVYICMLMVIFRFKDGYRKIIEVSTHEYTNNHWHVCSSVLRSMDLLHIKDDYVCLIFKPVEITFVYF